MKLDPQQHGETIERALRDGRSYRDIARELGCVQDTVSKFVRTYLPDMQRLPAGQEPFVQMNVLLIDIETAPNLVWSWGLWNQNISTKMIVTPARMMCFVSKWLDNDVVQFHSEYDGRDTMLRTVWGLLNRADAVLHYNGKRFDVPHLNREFIQAGMDPPSPYKQIDLLPVARRKFKFPSNKLAHVSEALGLEGKVEHEGFGLWKKCMDGDADAWERMRAYNTRDVLLLEELYYKLLPWIDGHPSLGAFAGEDVCPNCGSGDLTHAGWFTTTTGKYKQFRCSNCRKHSRNTYRDYTTKVAGVAT